MELKKSKQADLENKKSLFFQIGLVIALSFLLFAFEWKSIPTEPNVIEQFNDFPIDEEFTPVTRQIELPPPPPIQKVVEDLNIVADNLNIKETDIPSMEADPNSSVNYNQTSRNDEEYDEDELFFLVEEMPKFNGGDQNEFGKYINQKLAYPEIAKKKKITGTVNVQFTVNAKGEVCNVVVLSGIDPLIDQEVIRIIKASPRWTPGKERGHPVSVQYNFPITFINN